MSTVPLRALRVCWSWYVECWVRRFCSRQSPRAVVSRLLCRALAFLSIRLPLFLRSSPLSSALFRIGSSVQVSSPGCSPCGEHSPPLHARRGLAKQSSPMLAGRGWRVGPIAAARLDLPSFFRALRCWLAAQALWRLPPHDLDDARDHTWSISSAIAFSATSSSSVICIFCFEKSSIGKPGTTLHSPPAHVHGSE